MSESLRRSGSIGLTCLSAWLAGCGSQVNTPISPITNSGTDVSGANGQLSFVIPPGLYDGSRSAIASDTNLLASNIVSGVSIFGVTGNATGAFGACTDNALNAGQCTTAASRYVTSTAGANVSGANGLLTTTIPQGFYDGTQSASMSDANLVAGNIASGVTIFGVTGTAAGGAFAACTDNALNAGQCSTAANRYVASAVGANVNGANGSSSATIPQGFYDGTQSCSMADANLLAANIASGVTIFGVTGTAAVFNSNAYRNQATPAITQAQETTTHAGAAFPAGYQEVPRISTDDDGYVSAGVTSSQVTLVNRAAFVNCGTAQSTIVARISDCATQNGADATWDGSVKGNAGQGAWKLVTRAAANQEVWQDQRTGLVWSSVLTAAENWCRASGNAEVGDPSNYCDNVIYQPTSESWCAETGTTVEAAGSGEVWATPVYHASKGGMGATATATSPSVRWRLPTKYDYQLADNNGIRFVMPEMATTGSAFEWSASVNASSVNRADAWAFHGATGSFATSVRTTAASVRCVGR